MIKVFAAIGATFVLMVSGYVSVLILSDSLTYSHGQKAVESAHPFLKGAASKAGEKLKETIRQTPDKKLEEDAEAISRKSYFITKGIMKGHLDAILDDSNRAEVPQQMFETGKTVSRRVVKPFADGLLEGSSEALEGVNRTADKVRGFLDQNQDLIQSIGKGIEFLRRNAPPLPPPPSPSVPFHGPPHLPSPFPVQPPAYGHGPESSVPPMPPPRQPQPPYYEDEPNPQHENRQHPDHRR